MTGELIIKRELLQTFRSEATPFKRLYCDVVSRLVKAIKAEHTIVCEHFRAEHNVENALLESPFNIIDSASLPT